MTNAVTISSKQAASYTSSQIQPDACGTMEADFCMKPTIHSRGIRLAATLGIAKGGNSGEKNIDNGRTVTRTSGRKTVSVIELQSRKILRCSSPRLFTKGPSDSTSVCSFSSSRAKPFFSICALRLSFDAASFSSSLAVSSVNESAIRVVDATRTTSSCSSKGKCVKSYLLLRPTRSRSVTLTAPSLPTITVCEIVLKSLALATFVTEMSGIQIHLLCAWAMLKDAVSEPAGMSTRAEARGSVQL
mmetsp:Transcript_31687/g.74013  ORF Transcript_31687/g.74013 Transcript_31687/m.74013 type:complete len:245 (+) Transcript_31687:345-1079(+)